MYQIEDKKIIVSKEDFDVRHILFCGQIFCYEEKSNAFTVFSKDKKAEIFEHKNCYEIITDNLDFFVKFFDLTTDYSRIKERLSSFEILQKPIEFGKGIRILKNDKFEMLISFIISANNNIKRIQKIINALKEKCGQKMDGYFAFPTREEMLTLSEEDFAKLGTGYRAKYLYNVIRQVDEETLEKWGDLETKELRERLLTLFGVGPKVADCIMLFGYYRQDVFPVDTWIAQMYNEFVDKDEQNRNKIREKLLSMFGDLSGYAQQYLFFYQRSFLG